MGSPKRRSLARRIFLAAIGMTCAACGIAYATRLSWGPGMIITAPNPGGGHIDAPDDVARVDVERGDAHIQGWVVDPDEAPRGTLLLLHGIRDSKVSQLPSAREHARAGFRAVVVDSRGHGESSGPYLTYGVEESQDLMALVDELERRSLLVPPLAVIGTSYGAATAIQYAAIDERVLLTIALASFASLEEVVAAYVEWILGPIATLVPSSLFPEVLAESSRLANFDPGAASPRRAAARLRTPLRLVHSRNDERIPIAHARAIAAAARDVELVELSDASHNDTGAAPQARSAIVEWLEALAPER